MGRWREEGAGAFWYHFETISTVRRTLCRLLRHYSDTPRQPITASTLHFSCRRCLSAAHRKVNPPYTYSSFLSEIYLEFFSQSGWQRWRHSGEHHHSLKRPGSGVLAWGTRGGPMGRDETNASPSCPGPFRGCRPQTAPSKDRKEMSAAQGERPSQGASRCPPGLARVSFCICLVFQTTCKTLSRHEVMPPLASDAQEAAVAAAGWARTLGATCQRGGSGRWPCSCSSYHLPLPTPARAAGRPHRSKLPKTMLLLN